MFFELGYDICKPKTTSGYWHVSTSKFNNSTRDDELYYTVVTIENDIIGFPGIRKQGKLLKYILNIEPYYRVDIQDPNAIENVKLALEAGLKLANPELQSRIVWAITSYGYSRFDGIERNCDF